jgi:hypothetical protein
MSGWGFPEGLCTLLANHHSISQPSTASWKLASSSRRLSGHVSHRARWPAPLMPKGSWDACTSQGIATFLLAVSRHRDPFPLYLAFPDSLVGRDSHEYDGSAAPTRAFVTYPPIPTVSPLLTPVSSRNTLLLQSLPTNTPFWQVNARRRKDDTRVGTAARGIVICQIGVPDCHKGLP